VRRVSLARPVQRAWRIAEGERSFALKRILCPVDSSEFSRHALRYASALAGWYGAQLTVLSVRPRVIPSPSRTGPAPALPLWNPELGEQALRAFVDEEVGPIAAQIVSHEGSVIPEIVRSAADLRADLIVIGTHGLAGLERWLLGSVTERLLREADCPVLTVPHRANPSASPVVSFTNILCGIDFSQPSERGLEYALSLARAAGGRIAVVHALEWFEEELWLSTRFGPGPTLEEKLRAELEAHIPANARGWCDPEFVVAHGKARRELLRVAEERHADLIVLGVRKRGAIDEMVFGSTAAHVVRDATCPVLTMTEQR